MPKRLIIDDKKGRRQGMARKFWRKRPDKDATEYLLQYGNLEEAYERSGGEVEYIKKKINTAKRAVTSALQYAYKHKGDKEIITLLKELVAAAEELGKVLSK